jgi:hypothetical protein
MTQMKLFFTFCIVLYVLLLCDFIYFAFFVLYMYIIITTYVR